jgi:hypothetical protein
MNLLPEGAVIKQHTIVETVVNPRAMEVAELVCGKDAK